MKVRLWKRLEQSPYTRNIINDTA